MGFVAAVSAELETRPRTLIHGDFRSENVFKATDPANPLGYKIIDWQCLSPGPAGFDFVQLVTGSLRDVSDYSRLGELMKAHHDRLVELVPAAAKTYPYDTMVRDYALGYALIYIAFIGLLTPIMQAVKEIPGHP